MPTWKLINKFFVYFSFWCVTSYEGYLKLTPAQRQTKINQLQGLVEKPLQTNENKVYLWSEIGLIYCSQEDYNKAIFFFDQALKFNFDYYIAWNNRGTALYNLGRLEEAIASFDQALKIKPDNPNTYYAKALCYALQGNIELSLQNLQQAINLDEKYREMAKNDLDFDKIRSDKPFQKLVTSPK